MSQTSSTSVTPSAQSDRGHIIGLAVVGALVAFVAIWLYVQGREAIASPPRAVPRPVDTSNDARFNAAAFHLPNEPLLGFVEIPAGAFAMGSDPSIDRAAYDNERWSPTQTQGRVELPAFYMGRYEVTVEQYADFVVATKRAVDSQTLQAPATHPVTHVTWTDALTYAQWLETQLLQSTHAPAALSALLKDGWHLTLPSEAQWERAARGNDGRIFPWGNSPDATKANYARSGTVPVGSAACSECAFGLADMSGNVWELTRSPLQPYPYDAADTQRDAKADALFVMRGGAFNDTPNNVRAAIRGGIDPGARRAFIGFRLVLSKG